MPDICYLNLCLSAMPQGGSWRAASCRKRGTASSIRACVPRMVCALPASGPRSSTGQGSQIITSLRSLWSPLAVIRFCIRGENDRCHPLRSTPTGGFFPAPLFIVSRTATVSNACFQGKDTKGRKIVASRKFINLFDILGLILVGPEGFEPPTKGL